MPEIDWEATIARAEDRIQQSATSTPNTSEISETEAEQARSEFSSFVAKRRGEQKVPESIEDIDERGQIGKDLKRAYYAKVATALDAFGQFESSKEYWDLHNANAGLAEAPVFGELPSARFIKQTALEEGTDLAASVALLAIPVVGVPLFAADIFISLYGESRRKIHEETGIDQPLAAIAPATINASLDALAPVRILRKTGAGRLFTDIFKKTSNDGMFKRVVKKSGDLMATGVLEGSTEVVQGLVNEATVRLLTDVSIMSPLSVEDKNEMWGEFWAGLSAGASIDAVVSGVSTIGAQQKIQEIEDTLNRDKAILESLETGEPVKKKVRVNADGTLVVPAKPRQRVVAGTSVIPNADVETISLDDLLDDPALSEQDQRIANSVAALPDDERTIAIQELRRQISKAEFTLQSYRGLTSQEATVESEDIMQRDANVRISAHYSVPDPEVFPPSMMGEGNSILTQTVEENGRVETTSSTAPLPVQLAPFQIIGNPNNVTQEDFDMVSDIYDFIVKAGLNINPVTGKPMRFLYRLDQEPDIENNSSGSFAVPGEGTLFMKGSRSPNSRLQTPDANRIFLDNNSIHEMGHMLATQVLSQVDSNQLALIYNKWKQAISQEMTRGDYYRRYAPSYKRFSGKSKIRDVDRLDDGLKSNYSTSLQEFIAEQFMMAMSHGQSANKLPTHNGIRKAFSKLYQSVKKDTNSEVGMKPFKDFIEFLGTSKKIFELKEREKQLLRDEKAARSESDLVDTVDNPEKKNKQVTDSNLDNIDPTTDAGKVVNLLEQVGLHTQAEEVSSLININMGFLGNGLRGAAARKMLTPLQIAEQAGKKGFDLPTKYMELIQSFQVTKMEIIERANTRLRELRSLGPDALTRVSRALYLISTKSDENKARLSEDDLASVFRQLNMSEEEQTEWRNTDQFMLDMVNSLESAMLYDAAKIYLPDRASAKAFRDEYLQTNTKAEREALIEQYTGEPIVDVTNTEERLFNPLWEAAESVRKQIDGMRHRNYFPRSRLGEYAVKVTGMRGTVWENASPSRDGETLGFYSFDTQAEQLAFLESIASDMGNGLKARGYKMDSEVFSVMGMPSGIIDQIKRDVTGLSDLQKEQLGDIALQRSPGRKFLRHLTRRRGVAGYSEDALRVFANYASSASNHVARAEWASDLTDAIGDMDRAIANAPGDAVATNDLNVITQYFKKHLNYVMKPDNDWARLRAMGFLFYLGFNPKSAAVNIMQTPMVLYPTLAAHTSDKNALKRIGGAMYDAARYMRGNRTLDADVMNTIQHMIESGLIDESMVSELAGVSEGNGLRRLVPGMDLKTTFDKFAHAGGAMFRVGEKFNRYITAIAAHRVAKDNGLEGDDIIKFARDMIQGSQFEYAKWNRAEFMRGRQSAIFLFWQYMQHANYLLFGGKGSKTATRMWVMALMIAGIEGLPFAEFILDFLDFGGTKIKQMTGSKNPRVDLRHDLRELITQIYDRPDDILKGASYRFGLGPLHAASLLGVPVPNVSTRGSLSYGNPVPWFDGFTDPTITNDEKLLAKTTAAILGPVGGMGLGIIDALYSKDPDNWKRWEKVLPLFMRNASTGIRWAEQGGETDFSKAKILTFTTPEQRAEMVLKSLGFQPTRVDQTRQQIRATQVPILYTQIRREELIRQLDYATLTKNKEGRADVLQAIRDFNAEIRNTKGLKPYQINSTSIIRSLKSRQKDRALKEAGIRQGKKGIQVQRNVEKLYPID